MLNATALHDCQGSCLSKAVVCASLQEKLLPVSELKTTSLQWQDLLWIYPAFTSWTATKLL